MCIYHTEIPFSFSLGIDPKVNLMLDLFLIIWGTSILFSTVFELTVYNKYITVYDKYITRNVEKSTYAWNKKRKVHKTLHKVLDTQAELENCHSVLE